MGPMTIHEVLRLAITFRRCVRIRTAGFSRDICPHALGLKDGSPRVLALQYAGGSVSGLTGPGQWRAFFVHGIADAEIIDGKWRSGPSLIAKIEACLDRVSYRVKNPEAAD
jgi:hypothetical protein